ncbi:TIP41-like protein [Hirschfeldia incana]|nr:TIP41-like protein [Hirschfeldia incana]
MEPTSVIDDAEFSLPPEFLTDDDFLVEKAWGSTRCGAGGRQNQNRQMQVSSQKVADELALMNINGCNNHNGKGLLDLPRKHLLAAAKIPNDGSGYYNRQSLHYQKLQAIQQLKQQQQLVRYRRQLIQQSRGLGANNNNNNKIAGSVDLLPSAWSNQPQKLDVVLGNRTGKRGSTGTGVFLPRCVNNATGEVRERPSNGSG